MRLSLVLLAMFVSAVSPAWAQRVITLHADPVPIVEAEINGRAVRLEVDTRFPDMLALNAAAAERLQVRRLPFAVARVGIEGSNASLRARIARPRLTFDGEDARAFAGVFAVPVTSRADGVIGPGVLPYDVITIVLGPAPANAREISFALADPDVWRVATPIDGEALRITFDATNQASIFNRTAARRYDSTGAIVANGDLAELPLVLGLRTLMQPVATELRVEGLSLGPAFARTNAPLLGAIEEDAIVVEADADAPPAELSLGREALRACSSISVDRRTRRLTLICAG